MTPRMRARMRARTFWESLALADRWQLGDELVLGYFDWHDWFDAKPEPGVLAEVDRLRMFWEDMQ